MSTQEQRRQQVSTDNTNARRASGAAMRDDMRALAEPPKLRQPMPPIPKRGHMAAARGTGEYTAAASAAGGVAGPLTETPETRIYGEEVVVVPPAGFFAYTARPITQLTFKDAMGSDVVVNMEAQNYGA